MNRGRTFGRARRSARDSRFWKTKQGPSKQLSKEQSASYQGAFEAVLAVPIAIGIGYWCDGQFDSAPIGLFSGTAIGFAAMLLRVTRMRPSETETDRNAESSEFEKPGLDTPERDDESDR